MRKKVFRLITGPAYLLPVNPSVEKIIAPDSLNLRRPQFTNKQGREKVYNFRARVVEICAEAFNWKLASDKEMDEFETILGEQPGLYIKNILEFLN